MKASHHPVVSVPKRGLLIALLICIETYSVTQGMIVPAIPSIAAGYGIDVTSASWVLSANLAVTAVAVPILGRLGDIYGRRPILMLSLVLYGAGSILAAMAPTFGMLVVGRGLAGLGGGVFGLTYALAREWLPLDRRTRAISLLSIGVSFGAMIGLPLGGFFLDFGSYHAILWANVVSALIGIVAVLTLIPRRGLREPAKIDIPGAVGLAFVVALPLLALARITKNGAIDPAFLAELTAAAIAAVLFIGIESRTKSPMIDVRLAKSKQVLIANIVSFFVGVGNFALMVQIPLIAQDGGAGLGLAALASALLLLPGSLMQLPVAFAVGTLITRFGNRVVLAMGSGLSALGFIGLSLAHLTALAIIVGVVVVFSGIGFCFAASVNVVVQNVPSSQTGEATGLNALIRIVGSALCAPVIIGIMSRGSSVVDGRQVLVASSISTAFALLAVTMAGSGILTLALRRVPPLRNSRMSQQSDIEDLLST